MKADVLAHFPFPWLTCLALLLFFLVFLGVLAWVFRPARKRVYMEMERLIHE
jgi:cbb3-type cytochrome oxidase subunit 3